MNFASLVMISVFAINALALVEMAYYRRCKEKGEVHYPWLFPLCIAFYALMNAGTLVEFHIIPRKMNLIVTAFGFMFLAAKFVLKYFSARRLGKYWGVHIEVRPRHILVTDGIFGVLRHPGYASTVFEMLAIPLIANAYYAAAVTALGYAALLALRIILEEQALTKEFGDAYIRYKSTTNALVPFRKMPWLRTMYKEEVRS